MKYLLIGNSTAAIGCVEGIRSRDPEGEITIVSSENHHTYGRPLISYLLEGKTDVCRMRYRPESFYRDMGVRTKLGVTVEKILPDTHEVLCSDGEKLPYDRLLCATGSSPLVPPFAGLEKVGRYYTFMTLDDAQALAEALTPESRVLIVGAGLIGLKCAEGIRERCAKITVVDMASRILPSVLNEDAAAIVQKHIEATMPVEFVLGDSVKSFAAGEAVTESGKKLRFDVLVIAVGVRPNTALISGIGGKVGRGIAVDEGSRTNLDGIYAAGDCTECYDISADKTRVLALLPNAYMQGYTAGVNMAGGDTAFRQAIPMNAAGFCGLHIITAGDYSGQMLLEKNDGVGQYKALYVRDNRLVGYILIGDVDCAGIYTSLIRDRVPLDSLDFEMIRKTPRLMAFAKNVRQTKLNG